MSVLPHLTSQRCPVILRPVLATVSPNRIYQARLAAGLTQAEVAHRLRSNGLSKVSERSIRRWESGKNTPHANVVPHIARVLSVEIGELYGADEDDEEADPVTFDGAMQVMFERAVAKRVEAELRKRGLV